ncbi:MAG: YicC/YloC family endoribonuclease [Parvibaculum sp.]
MSLNSMTGFGRVDGTEGAYRWHWEVRSVNGKGLDCRFRLPSGFEALEPKFRDLLGHHVRRGNCQAGLVLEATSPTTSVQVNPLVASQVLVAAKQMADIAAEQGITLSPPTVEGLLAIRGVLETQEAVEDSAAREGLEKALLKSFADAAKNLALARADEGRKLNAIIEDQIGQIATLTEAATNSPANSEAALKARLKAQMNELLDASAGLSEERLAQEAALLATKADVREELDRLRAHVLLARELIVSGEPIGRRLDFLTQEFNREANTLCSKSSDASLTRIGLDLKAVIDQLKEQVQNVE